MKLININHKTIDYNCMWNGIEDIYRTKTNNDIPNYLFFGLSGFCNPIYLSNKNSAVPKSVYFSAGMPKKMYDFMSKIIGFSFTVIENREFNYTFKKAKEQIDKGNPVILGAIDMFYLDYFKKFHKKIHIPIHYITMIGYDDEKSLIYLLENSREEILSLSYENLKLAWDVETEGFSKKNTMYILQFNDALNNVKDIFYNGLEEKCKANLHSKVKFIGVNAINKLAKEISSWKTDLNDEEYKNCLSHLVEFTGFPPSLPFKENLHIKHSGARYEFSELLKWGALQYNEPRFKSAADYFFKSGEIIEYLSNVIFDYLSNNNPIPSDLENTINQIYENEKKGYEEIEKIFSI